MKSGESNPNTYVVLGGHARNQKEQDYNEGAVNSGLKLREVTWDGVLNKVKEIKEKNPGKKIVFAVDGLETLFSQKEVEDRVAVDSKLYEGNLILVGDQVSSDESVKNILKKNGVLPKGDGNALDFASKEQEDDSTKNLILMAGILLGPLGVKYALDNKRMSRRNFLFGLGGAVLTYNSAANILRELSIGASAFDLLDQQLMTSLANLPKFSFSNHWADGRSAVLMYKTESYINYSKKTNNKYVGAVLLGAAHIKDLDNLENNSESKENAVKDYFDYIKNTFNELYGKDVFEKDKTLREAVIKYVSAYNIYEMKDKKISLKDVIECTNIRQIGEKYFKEKYNS